MTRFRISLSVGGAALGLMLFLGTASAQIGLNRVSFVALGGSDAAGCQAPEAACQTINGALAQTEPGGEIKCLDNWHDGSTVTIDKPITIDCDAPSTLLKGFGGQAAVTVNLNETNFPNGVVTLRNLTINGLSGNVFPPGSDGIRVIGGGAAVHVENCTIQGGSEQGIDFAPTSTVDLFVRDTVIGNNAGGGILLKPTGGASARATFDNVAVEGNATGVLIDGRFTTGNNSATIRNSALTGNFGHGLSVADSGGGATNVVVDGSTSADNASFGIGANGANATVRVKNSTVTGNANGLIAAASSNIISQGGNTVAGNTTNGAFTSSLPLQ